MFGNNPPDLSVHVGDLTIEQVLELQAIASKASLDGMSSDTCMSELIQECDED